MKKNSFLTHVLALFLIISGCSSGGDTPQVVIPLDTSVIRTYQQGDRLAATMTLRDTATGNTATGTVNLVVGTIVQNPFGIDCRAFAISGTVTGPNGTEALSVRSLLYQDTDNSLYECGEFNENLGRYTFLTDTATTPNGVFLSLESPVQLGNSTSGVIFFDDGSWQDCTSTVQLKENVSTPVGLYESYRVSHSCSFSDGTTIVGTWWRVPSIFNLKESAIIDGVSAEMIVTSVNYK